MNKGRIADEVIFAPHAEKNTLVNTFSVIRDIIPDHICLAFGNAVTEEDTFKVTIESNLSMTIESFLRVIDALKEIEAQLERSKLENEGK